MKRNPLSTAFAWEKKLGHTLKIEIPKSGIGSEHHRECNGSSLLNFIDCERKMNQYRTSTNIAETYHLPSGWMAGCYAEKNNTQPVGDAGRKEGWNGSNHSGGIVLDAKMDGKK